MTVSTYLETHTWRTKWSHGDCSREGPKSQYKVLRGQLSFNIRKNSGNVIGCPEGQWALWQWGQKLDDNFSTGWEASADDMQSFAPSPRSYSLQPRFTNLCKPSSPSHWEVPTPYLEHEDAHVGHSQVNLGSLSVRSLVKPDAIHFQLPGDLEHLEIWLSWRLAPVIKDSRIIALRTRFWESRAPHRGDWVSRVK